jgi:hypothetical protein
VKVQAAERERAGTVINVGLKREKATGGTAKRAATSREIEG